MFIMLNSARLDVGVQGIGIAERSFQRALAYAQERRQGRAPGVRSGRQVPIYEHPDVRRMLFTMKALIEAGRGICYANAVAYDLARTSPDEELRASASALEGLLTPISKAWSTDRASEITSLGVQVHGGMGYVEETGAAQHMRDCRIAAIYEGTNGIQAMDLVGRKLQGDGGEAARNFIADANALAETAAAHSDTMVANSAGALRDAAGALAESTDWLLSRAAEDQDDVLAGAGPYLRQFGNVAGGFYLLRGTLSAIEAGDLAERDLDYRRTLLGFYADNILAEAVGLTAAVTSGVATLARLDPDAFGG